MILTGHESGMRGVPVRLGRGGRGSPCLMGPFSPRFPLLPFVPLSQTMAAPVSPTLVLGEASESDSEPEPGGNAAETPAAGLKVPGEASETEEEEEEGAARVPLPGVSRGAPSLLQQWLRDAVLYYGPGLCGCLLLPQSCSRWRRHRHGNEATSTYAL
ncbi:biogenesis of lysosome-related organelles complex 1 subunit 3 isoform X1 [Numida meleagris]|uniref:biogenesis of lysosome-related organelles complex 1 subunit 3 isoform X1 n=1 Tax=Numida meleagris TaxID=8996 RepID=UPI000B3DF10E|nr:biogenesis of lysosome-related organelles complex 1 subunit 3 isoform X1 [Numida meleagris]